MTAYTRRYFANLLQAGAAMAVAGFRPPGLNAMIPAGSRHFEPLIGSEFRVASLSGGQLSLTLIAVEDIAQRRPAALVSAGRVDCALLRFSAGGFALAEGTYRLVHERYGDYELYLNAGKPGRYLAYLCQWRELPR